MSEWVNEEMSERVNGWMSEWESKWMREWLKARKNQWMSEWVNEEMSERVNYYKEPIGIYKISRKSSVRETSQQMNANVSINKAQGEIEALIT